MLQRIRKSLEQREEGFTLIELLVVIIIIGILAAIAIPVFLNQRRKAWDSAAKSDVKNMATAEESYLTESPTGVYSAAKADLTAQGFKPSGGVEHGVCTYTTDNAGDSYVVAASHTQSSNIWYFDSQGGTVTSTVPAGCAPVLSATT